MVVIQVLIAEVELNDTDEFGVELGLQDSLLFDRSLLSETEFVDTTVNEQGAGGATVTTQTQSIISTNLAPGYNFNNQALGNNGSTTSIARAGNVGAQALSSFALSRVNNSLGFGGFVMSASSSNINFLLRALQESRRLEVLSRPQITTLDGKPGRVQVGASVPTVQGVTLTQFGQTNNIQYQDVGIILEVQPRISVDGQVVMNVLAEKSELGPEAEGVVISVIEGSEVRSPQIKTTRATTTVSAASGQTIVLSGLLTKSTFDLHRRVPLLADIPLIGDLFRYDAVQQSRKELLIILTPRVIRSELDAEMLKQVESSRMSWVLSDVIEMHGPSGLRTRGDAWDDVPGCYPTEMAPEGPVLGEVQNAAPTGAAVEPAAEDASRVEAASYSKPFIPPRRLPTVAQ
jgi:general secretion pathway protein D